MYRSARSWAGVILTGSTGSGAGAVCGGSAFGGSWRSGGGGPGAGTLFGGLGLFLLPGGGLFAWGASRAQQPPQVPAQALGQAPQALEQAPLGSLLALAPRAQARAPRRHFPPFLFRKILVFIVQKNREGNAGALGVYHISIHVGEFEAQITQSNRAV